MDIPPPDPAPAPDSDCAIMRRETAPERFVRLDEVKRRVGLGKSMIYQLIKQGSFPPPYKLSPAAARWSDQEISAWINDVKDGFEGKKRTV